MTDRPNYAPEIKRALSDPQRVLEALGILGEGRDRQRQAGGFLIRCPIHEERTPSCSVQTKSGILVWKCHGCDAAGDVLTLVAAVRGLSLKSNFRDVLVECARLGGLWHVVAELEGRAGEAPPGPAAPLAARPEEPERVWPPAGEVSALWAAAEPIETDPEVGAYLRGRAIDPDRVDAGELARVLGPDTPLPRWARCRFGDWHEAGYRLIVPMLDTDGSLRSVRAWRVTPGDGPKRLPPTGHKASGLVMADLFGALMLRGERSPERVVVVEGEPDFMTWATRLNDPATATIGIVNGSWCNDFAHRIPIGARVDVRVDHDEAGARYFAEIEASLRRRAFVFRSKEAA